MLWGDRCPTHESLLHDRKHLLPSPWRAAAHPEGDPGAKTFEDQFTQLHLKGRQQKARQALDSLSFQLNGSCTGYICPAGQHRPKGVFMGTFLWKVKQDSNPTEWTQR